MPNKLTLKALLFIFSISTPLAHSSNERQPNDIFSSKKTEGKNVFKNPITGLSKERQLEYRVGEAIFEKLWVFAPSSTQASDGLGPLYNARACSQCHTRNGRPTFNFNKAGELINPVGLVIALKNPLSKRGDPTYGKQIQSFAYPNGKIESNVSVRYETIDGTYAEGSSYKLHKPNYHFDNEFLDTLSKDTSLSPRIANPVIGLGFLERIPTKSILNNHDPDDADKDGISGRARFIDDQTIGRFGWKANQPSIASQNAHALAFDIGISSRLFPLPYGDCTEQQKECLSQANGNTKAQDGLEASDIMMEALRLYVANTAVPERSLKNIDEVKEGKQLFSDIGCDSCHTPSFEITLAERALTIRPYSDLLLHDLGEPLSDEANNLIDDQSEWRTPPLWGISYQKQVNGQLHLLHDGRARSVEEAILWHGGEALSAKESFVDLNTSQRQHLINFVESL